MTEYHAGRLTDLSESGRRVLKCGDVEIGVFVIDGEIHAWHSECAHRGGPVCQGRLMKRVIEPLQADKTIRTAQYQETETHIVCPWHGYEYNIKTGEHPGHPGLKLRRAAVTVRNGDVYVIPG